MSGKRNFILATAIPIIILVVLVSVILVTRGRVPRYSISELPDESAEFRVLPEGFSLAGFWDDRNTDGQGIYLACQTKLLEIYFCPEGGEEDERLLIYRSELPVAAYQTFSVDNHMFLLEMYTSAGGEMSFDIIRIGYGHDPGSVEKIFTDRCDRFPHLCVAVLNDKQPFFMDTGASVQLEERVIVNHDHGGRSYLTLLNSCFGPGNVNTSIDVGDYEYLEGGNLAAGKRIMFCGGYGDYIYYQVVYSILLDPHTEVANFESHGKPALYRYHIGDGTIENIWPMDKIALHVNANSKVALVSEYDYHVPLSDSGKIILLSDKSKRFTIPGIESGSDIKESRFLSENRLVFYTPEMLFFADLGKKLIYTYKLNGGESIHLRNVGVTLTQSGKNSTSSYHTMLFEDIFEE